MDAIHRLFVRRVRQLRREQGLSAVDVAALIGCDVSHYYAIERGGHPPSFALLVAIAKALRVDEADLFTWPGGGLRHDLRERLRLCPAAAMSQIAAHFTQVPTAAEPSASPASTGAGGAVRPRR